MLCQQASAQPGLCAACVADLPALTASCRLCAEPLPGAPASELCCARCQQRPPPWAACQAVLPYAWPVDVALQRLKYARQLGFARAFGELLAQHAARHCADVDALCPVPLHRLRHLRRGFNQADELSKPLRRATRLPWLRNVRRVRHTAAQSGLGLQARRKNLRHAFRAYGALQCRHPLIIDDVMTTGETCRQLAAALLRHGADQVSVLVVARAAARQLDAGLNA